MLESRAYDGPRVLTELMMTWRGKRDNTPSDFEDSEKIDRGYMQLGFRHLAAAVYALPLPSATILLFCWYLLAFLVKAVWAEGRCRRDN